MLKMHYPHREKQSVQLLLYWLGLLTLMDVAKELQLRSNELLEPQKRVTGIDRTGWGKDSVSLTLNCLVLFFFLKERALSSWLRTSSTAKRFIFKHLTKCRLISDRKFLFGYSPTLFSLPAFFFPPSKPSLAFFFLLLFFVFLFFALVIWPRITYPNVLVVPYGKTPIWAFKKKADNGWVEPSVTYLFHQSLSKYMPDTETMCTLVTF